LNELGVSGAVSAASRPAEQRFRFHGSKRFLDGGSGNFEVVNALQFILNSAGPTTMSAQFPDPFTVLARNLGSR
jgi:hypothetical protein